MGGRIRINSPVCALLFNQEKLGDLDDHEAPTVSIQGLT
jgi:hypothetical protein